jgi:hypothetical protein
LQEDTKETEAKPADLSIEFPGANISRIDVQQQPCEDNCVILTLELSDLRESNEKALTELSRAPVERFDAELGEIKNFLLSVYRFAVLAVRNEREIGRAAAAWRETLDVIDSATRQVQALATQRGISGTHPALDRILEIRSAASDMLALYE